MKPFLSPRIRMGVGGGGEGGKRGRKGREFPL